jgi:hypothetical protein
LPGKKHGVPTIEPSDGQQTNQNGQGDQNLRRPAT